MGPQTFLVPLWLLLVQTPPEKSWPVNLESDKYSLSSTAPEEKAQSLLEHMNLAHDAYSRLLNLTAPRERKMALFLYKNYDEYLAAGAPEGTVAYYNGTQLVGYYNDHEMYSYFAHEGFHQIVDVGLGALQKAHPWFNEGMADCVGNSAVREGKLYLALKDGLIARENLAVVRLAVEQETVVPLRSFLSLDNKEFMLRAGLYYPQAWSLCHFLMLYPDYEALDEPMLRGKYAPVLRRYIESLKTPDFDRTTALAAAFVDAEGQSLDLDHLEKEWKEYLLKWPIR